LKKATKKKFAEEKQYSTGTRGGPSAPTNINRVDLEIKSILGDSQVDGNFSEFDSDVMLIELPVSYPEKDEEKIDDEGNSNNKTFVIAVSDNDFKQVINLKSLPKS
jgi:hypothetical protein